MKYCIKNRKNLYLKLNSNGAPVTCTEGMKGTFEYAKAMNILSGLPKTLKRLNFTVEPIPEIYNKKKKESIKKDYVPTEDVIRWVDKFGMCADILNEAKQREEYLINELQNIDKEILDILHIIEIENPKDMFGAWKLYKSIRTNREKRRNIKDELMIVESVLSEINPVYLQRERVQKAVDGLMNRKYTFRIVDNEKEENDRK